MQISFPATLLALLIGGPILLGLLAWLAPSERARTGVAGLAAFGTALAGLVLAAHGPLTLTGGTLLRHAGDALEYVMILAFLAIGYRSRIWLVFGLALAQLAAALWGHTGSGGEHAAPAFVLDALSTILVLIISIIGSAIVFYGIGYMRRHEHHAPATAASTGRFFFFLTGFLGVMNGLVLTDNLKWLSIFWEATTLCSFFLIGHDGTPVARQNARRALVINAIGGAAMSFGSALVTHSGGDGSLTGLIQTAAVLPLALLLLASFTKSAQMPFQSWLLGAMVAPTPVSALLHSSTMVKAGSYLVLRLTPGFESTPLAPIVAFAGAFTFAVTSAIAISQSNAKKVLAYSTIANLGLIVACAGIHTPLAYAAGLAILIYHAISKALLFLCVGVMAMRLGVRSISKISGLYARMPVAAVCFFVGVLAVTGIPPFSCFWSKLTLVVGIMELKGAAMPLIAVPYYLEIVIGFFWFLKVGQRLLFGEPSPAVLAIAPDSAVAGTGFANGVLLVLAALAVVMPLIVYPFVRAL
jgi:ech hydrogenase subunit A